MIPEVEVIGTSSLYKFKRKQLKDVDLLNMLINKTVGIALEKGTRNSDTSV